MFYQYFWSFHQANEYAMALGKTIAYRSMRDLLKNGSVNKVSVSCSMIQVHDEDRELGDNLTEYFRYLAQLSPDSVTRVIRLRLLHESRVKGLVNETSLWSGLIESGELDFKLTTSTIASQILIPGTLYLSRETFWVCLTTDDQTSSTFRVDTVHSDSERHYTQISEVNYRLSVIEIGEYIPRQSIETQESNSLQAKIIVFVITWTHPIFIENAFGLAEAITECSHNLTMTTNQQVEVYVAAEMSLQVYNYFQDNGTTIMIHIPVSTVDDMTVFGKHSIVYNSEHPSYEKVFGRIPIMRYIYLFHYKHTMIWSYNQLSINHLCDNVFSNTFIEIPKNTFLYYLRP